MLKRKGFVVASFLLSSLYVAAQDNSPYSRYGLGDVVPNTHIVNRAMGGISAAYRDFLSVNFNNPASYSAFQTQVEQRSGKGMSGRALLDVGINLENRTLREPNTTNKFTSPNLLFSYIQFGIPLKKNWGLSFGLRPLSRISYKLNRRELITDPTTGQRIDSALTEFAGSGGAYLPSIGTGIAIKNLSIGGSIGYLFGKREASSRRAFLNDTVSYYNGAIITNSYFGDLFFNAGLQYKIDLNKHTALRLGASGNLKQSLRGEQQIAKETFTRSGNGDQPLDSISQTENRGDVIYPGMYTVGFTVERTNDKNGGWLLGADVVMNQWDDFRLFGAKDAVKNNWQLRAGGQYRPNSSRSYFSNIAYRAGFYTGTDYITAGGDLPQFGVTAGVGLPIGGYNQFSRGQFSLLNLAFEYNRRGNDNNSLKESMFRVSAGFSLSDLWFVKRRYD